MSIPQLVQIVQHNKDRIKMLRMIYENLFKIYEYH